MTAFHVLAHVGALVVALAVLAAQATGSPTGAQSTDFEWKVLPGLREQESLAITTGWHDANLGGVDFVLQDGPTADCADPASKCVLTHAYAAFGGGEDTANLPAQFRSRGHGGKCNGMKLVIFNERMTRIVAVVNYVHVIPDESLWTTWTTLADLERTPVDVGSLTQPHPNNPRIGSSAHYSLVLQHHPGLVDYKDCPSTGAHLHHHVTEWGSTIKTKVMGIDPIEHTNPDGSKWYEQDCISRDTWFAKLSSSTPEVTSREDLNSTCPPTGLKLAKKTYESISTSFDIGAYTWTSPKVQLFGGTTTREALCHPEDELSCSPLSTLSGSQGAESMDFSGLTTERWYQARAQTCDASGCSSWGGLSEPFQLLEQGIVPPGNLLLAVDPGNWLGLSLTLNNATETVEHETYRCTVAGSKCLGSVLVSTGSAAAAPKLRIDPEDGGHRYAVRVRACVTAVPELPQGEEGAAGAASTTPEPFCGQWSELTRPVMLTGHALVKHVVGDGRFNAFPVRINNVYTPGETARLEAVDVSDEKGNRVFARWDVTDAAGARIATSTMRDWTVRMDGVRHVTATFTPSCASTGPQRQACTLPEQSDSSPVFPVIPIEEREFTFIQGSPWTFTVTHAIGGNEPVTYSLSSTPAGLSIDYDADRSPALRLTGTPTALQSRMKHTLTATDNDNDPAAIDIYITVVAPTPKVAQDMSGFSYDPARIVIGDAAPALDPPDEAVGTLSYSADPEETCTVIAGTGALTIVGVGTCTITVRAAETPTHLAGTATATVEVEKATPDLEFSYDPADPKVDAPNPTLEPPADSHLDLEYEAAPEEVCDVHETTGALTIEGAGECTITVSFDGSATHEAGSARAEVVVSKYEPDLSFSYSPRSITYGDPTPTLTPPTVESGVGALRYRTTSSDVCRVGLTTGALTIDGGGTCEVTLTSEETRTHEAGSAAATVTVAKRAVVLSFSYSPRSITYGDPTPTLNPPTVESGVGALRYQTTSSDVCRVGLTTGALTIRGGGTCEVSLTSEGTNSHHPGSAEAEVTVEKAEQTLTGFSYSPRSVEIDQTASPTGPDGAVGRLSYSASSECSVDSGGVVTGVSVGTCVVTVTAAMTNTHNAGSTTATVSVTRPAKVPQPLTGFSYTPNPVVLGNAVTLNAPTGAVGAVTYEVDSRDSSFCSVALTTGALTFSDVGTCDVTATAAETTTHLEGTAETSIRAGFGLTVNAGSGGTASASPSREAYGRGDQVRVTASPNNGYVISGWGDDCTSLTPKDSSCRLTMNGHRTASVTFEVDTTPAFALTEKRYHTIVGKQVSQLLPGATGGNGDLTYSLTGNLPPGMSFNSSTRRVTGAATSSAAGNAYWSTLTVEDCDGDTDTLRIRIYIKNRVTLTINISPVGTGTATGAGRYNEDDQVSISADAEDLWAFESWTGTDIADTESSSTTVTMGDSNKTITANFLNICDDNPHIPGCGARSEPAVPTVSIETSGQTVTGGTEVSLAATATGKKLSYAWAGTGTFSDATAEDPTWTAPAGRSSDQTYTLALTVATGDGATATATVDIVVSADTDADHDDGDAMEATP